MVTVSKKITKKGQIHIPKIFLDQFDINPGDTVLVEILGDGIIIKPKLKFEELEIILNKQVNNMRKFIKKPIKMGDLLGISLEDEFEDN
ncbi:MAG: AbrB/MazE/SpoVT family DNA-binding domain-containing protein [Candidatus Heimdallarchaeota archaeon]|nr:AbrB/MazE/SpoVT family DNA-binding domain-containing protein [Candidatus Heimdallarchaeota archaeon]